MKDSDLRFNILTAAAFGVVVILAPGTSRAADEAPGLYIGAGVGQSDVDPSCGVSGGTRSTSGAAWRDRGYVKFGEHLGIRGEWKKFNQVGNAATGGENDIQMWTVGLNYKF